MFANIV